MRTKLEIWAPCHPERSEGSALVRISRFDRSRFFVASLLRITRRAAVAQSDFLSNDRAGRQAWPRRAAVEDAGALDDGGRRVLLSHVRPLRHLNLANGDSGL